MTPFTEDVIIRLMVAMLIVAMFIPLVGEDWSQRAKRIARRSWEYLTTYLWVLAAVVCLLGLIFVFLVWKPRAVLLLADLVRFLANKSDGTSLPPTPASLAPTHADPRGQAKSAFVDKLKEVGAAYAFLERVSVQRRGTSCRWHCWIPNREDGYTAYASFDEITGQVRLLFYTQSDDKVRWLEPTSPHHTKESS